MKKKCYQLKLNVIRPSHNWAKIIDQALAYTRVFVAMSKFNKFSYTLTGCFHSKYITPTHNTMRKIYKSTIQYKAVLLTASCEWVQKLDLGQLKSGLAE